MTQPLDHDFGESSLRLAPSPEEELRLEGFGVGDWWVEPRGNRMCADDVERRLDPRLIEVLIALAARPGEVLTRDELLNAVWKDVYVSENSLSKAISRLRKALGDGDRDRYIETISRSGYRLLAPVRRKPRPEPPKAVVADAVVASTLGEDSRIATEATAATPPRGSQKPVTTGWLVAAIVGTLSTAAVLAMSFASRSGDPSTRSLDAPVAEVRPEVTLPGNQFGPRLSPDGTKLAFSWRESEGTNWDLWLQPIGGAAPVQRTHNPLHERLPTWSPDSERLAFVRFSTTDRESCGLFIVPSLGGPEERVVDCVLGLHTLDWSPNGRSLVHEGIQAEGSATTALFLVDLVGRERRLLSHPPDGIVGDTGARFSPDGTRLAFEREMSSYRHDVVVMTLENGETRALTSDSWGQVRGVDWSSDGSSVLFSSNRSGHFELWRVPVEGGEPRRVPILDTWVTQPSVSRAGGRLVYRTFRDSVDLFELAIDDRGGSAGEPVRRMASSRSERQPVWSPDGEAVAFISDRSGSNELWSGRTDGTELRRHTDLRGPIPGSPVWSPDGQRIVYQAAVDGRSALFSVSRDSSHSTLLSHGPAEAQNPSFSRDGQRLYFASNRDGAWNLWQLPASGSDGSLRGSRGDGELERVTRDGGFVAQESADGKLLYFTRPDEPGLWRVPRDAAASALPELVLAELDLSDWGSWTVGELGLYFVRRGPTSIGFLGWGASEPSLLYQPSHQMPFLGRELSYSWPKRALLFTLIDHSDDELMTVDLVGL